jgi:hypothetical protein
MIEGLVAFVVLVAVIGFLAYHFAKPEVTKVEADITKADVAKVEATVKVAEVTVEKKL